MIKKESNTMPKTFTSTRKKTFGFKISTKVFNVILLAGYLPLMSDTFQGLELYSSIQVKKKLNNKNFLVA